MVTATKNIDWIPEERIDDVSSITPTLVLSVCNGLIVPVTQAITHLEKWDYRY